MEDYKNNMKYILECRDLYNEARNYPMFPTLGTFREFVEVRTQRLAKMGKVFDSAISKVQEELRKFDRLN